MLYERLLIVTTKKGNVYATKISVDNYSSSVFRNGYSNWNGKRSVAGFWCEYTDSSNDLSHTTGITRKEAIEEAAYRLAGHREASGLEYKLVNL